MCERGVEKEGEKERERGESAMEKDETKSKTFIWSLRTRCWCFVTRRFLVLTLPSRWSCVRE